MTKSHTYFFKCQYDTNKGRTFTGRIDIEALTRLDALKNSMAKFKKKYPDGFNFRNTK